MVAWIGAMWARRMIQSMEEVNGIAGTRFAFSRRQS